MSDESPSPESPLFDSELRPTRRTFVKTLAAGAASAATISVPALTIAACAPAIVGGSREQKTGWDLVPDILHRIEAPSFPKRDFDITQYGARGDGTTDCSRAFRDAIAACSRAGGGRVVVPAGLFLTGPIHLESNVDLHVSASATVLFHRDPRRYLPPVFTRFEGTEYMGYSPFIYAFEKTNIAITGEGTLDGQADCTHWWDWKGFAGDTRSSNALDAVQARECGASPSLQTPARNRLVAMAEQGVPPEQRVFGEGSFLRPQFIQPYRCRNVLIEGVKIRNSPMWEIHPVLCQNVIVRNVDISSHGPNNDGCDPESCRDVLIEGTTFDTGDDCIAIKSGRNADGRRINVPSENIIIRNCRMKDGHGGVTIGSEISGGCRNVFAERNTMDSPNLDRALRLKNNASRGGVLEHIYMRDTTVGQVADAVVSIDFYYEEGPQGAFIPVARNIDVRNVTSQKSRHALYLRGFANAPISDIHLSDCIFANSTTPMVLEYVNGLDLQKVAITATAPPPAPPKAPAEKKPGDDSESGS